MPSAVKLREDSSASFVRWPGAQSRQPEPTPVVPRCGAGWNGSRISGRGRQDDWQTLRGWVHRFNAAGPDGLLDKLDRRPEAASVDRAAGGVRRHHRRGRIVRRLGGALALGSTSSAS